MSEFDYSELSDHGATGYERAHMFAMGGPMHAVPAEVIDTLWDALRVDVALLPLVAYQMGVNLYEEVWSIETKRAWVHDNWHFLSRRGTVSGVRMAIEVNGFELREILRPPQGFFASPEMSKAEHDAWVHLMPELRITFQAKTGTDNGQWFSDADYAGEAFAGIDDGPALYGNVAFVRQNGVSRPLVNISLVQSVEKRTAREVQAYSTTGRSTLGWFANDGAASADFFVNAEEVPAEIISFIADEAYDHVSSSLELTTTRPGLQPIDARYEIDSDTGWWGYQTFADECAAGEDFAGSDDAGLLLARRVYLLDPSVQVPRTIGFSYAGYDRVGMPFRTAEFMINLRTKAWDGDAYAEQVDSSGTYAMPENTEAQERAFRAMEASRGLLDRTLVRFDHVRPLTVNDPVSEGTRIGVWVNNSL